MRMNEMNKNDFAMIPNDFRFIYHELFVILDSLIKKLEIKYLYQILKINNNLAGTQRLPIYFLFLTFHLIILNSTFLIS